MAVLHFVATSEIYDIWNGVIYGIVSGGVVPVSWFLFTYCLLMLMAYPTWHLMNKNKLLFMCIGVIWMIFIVLGIGDATWRIKPQSLWIHLYLGYFIWGMCLNLLKAKVDKQLKKYIRVLFH